MLTITSNGSKWAGEAPDTIEDLCDVLTREPLDRSFECYGNFVITPDDEIGGPTRFFGNFANLSHVFNIDTDEPKTIERLTSLIRANQQTTGYLAQDEPVEKNRIAALRDTVWIYAKAAKRHATAGNGERLVRLANGDRVSPWNMSEHAMNAFIAEVS